MTPEIVEREAFLAVGMCGTFTQETVGEIGSLWGRCAARFAAIENVADHERCYGLCFGAEPDAPFFYMPAMEVTSLESIPPDMVGKIVPAARYAKFVYSGPIMGLGEFWGRIHAEWLPAAGLTVADGPAFEMYDERYDVETASGEMDIFVPVV